MVGINVGSGQRRFESTEGWDWINVDIQYRPPEQVPDVIANGAQALQGMTADAIVLHHVLEHFGLGEADDLIRACCLTLKPGGSLLVFVPDTAALVRRYMTRQIDDYTFRVNMHGAYQGSEADRHRWSYDSDSLREYLKGITGVMPRFFDWRKIPGADIAHDWWILGMECVTK